MSTLSFKIHELLRFDAFSVFLLLRPCASSLRRTSCVCLITCWNAEIYRLSIAIHKWVQWYSVRWLMLRNEPQHKKNVKWTEHNRIGTHYCKLLSVPFLYKSHISALSSTVIFCLHFSDVSFRLCVSDSDRERQRERERKKMAKRFSS